MENSDIIRKRLVDGVWIQDVIKGKDFAEPVKKHGKKKRKRGYRKVVSRENFYSSHEWAKARYKALKNSNGKCELCGRSSADGVVLNVDHIKPRHKYPKLELDQKNLQVLCNTCNWGKFGDDETDWRKKGSYRGLVVVK